MTFARGQSVAAAYRGEFADGKRAGLGVGVADGGIVWSGQWNADEACASGAPVAEQGRDRSAPDPVRHWATHHAAASSLPAPATE